MSHTEYSPIDIQDVQDIVNAVKGNVTTYTKIPCPKITATECIKDLCQIVSYTSDIDFLCKKFHHHCTIKSDGVNGLDIVSFYIYLLPYTPTDTPDVEIIFNVTDIIMRKKEE